MAATFSKEELQAELARRQGVVNASYESVLGKKQEDTGLKEFKKAGESLDRRYRYSSNGTPLEGLQCPLVS